MVIQVCISDKCHSNNCYDIINKLTQLIKQKNLNDKITIKAGFCFGHCGNGVSIKFDEQIYSVSVDTVEDFFKSVILK